MKNYLHVCRYDDCKHAAYKKTKKMKKEMYVGQKNMESSKEERDKRRLKRRKKWKTEVMDITEEIKKNRQKVAKKKEIKEE